MTKKGKTLLKLVYLTLPLFVLNCADRGKDLDAAIPPESTKTDRASGDDIRSLDRSINYADSLNGKFILSDSHCAGFEFLDKKTVTWTNEIFCNSPDTLRIDWIDSSTFFVCTTERHSEGCPPKVDVYKVASFNGVDLMLKSYWTGWGESKPDLLIFRKRADKP